MWRQLLHQPASFFPRDQKIYRSLKKTSLLSQRLSWPSVSHVQYILFAFFSAAILNIPPQEPIQLTFGGQAQATSSPPSVAPSTASPAAFTSQSTNSDTPSPNSSSTSSSSVVQEHKEFQEGKSEEKKSGEESSPAARTSPASQLPASQPPASQPPASQPPASQPPASQPPASQPPPAQPPPAQPLQSQPPASQPPTSQPPPAQPLQSQPPSQPSSSRSSASEVEGKSYQTVEKRVCGRSIISLYRSEGNCMNLKNDIVTFFSNVTSFGNSLERFKACVAQML